VVIYSRQRCPTTSKKRTTEEVFRNKEEEGQDIKYIQGKTHGARKQKRKRIKGTAQNAGRTGALDGGSGEFFFSKGEKSQGGVKAYGKKGGLNRQS